MTRIHIFFLMLGLCLVSNLCKAKIVDMTDFGLSAINPEMAEVKISRAFDFCIREQHKSKEKIIIKFEKAVYRISSSDVLFRMKDCQNIEIDGCGSTFLFSKIAGFASIIDSSNITLRNFTLDWSRPYISQAEITDMTTEYIDLKIDKQKYPWYIKGKRLKFICGGKEYGAAEYGYNIVYSKDGNIFKGSFDNYSLTSVINGPAEELAEGIIRCHGKIEKTYPLGNIIAIWHITYKTPWCISTDSENIFLKDITIRHTTGCGVVSVCTKDMTIDNVDYIPAEGRCFTGIADAFHIVHNSGKFLMQNCDIDGQGDDALNVHGRYLNIVSRNNRKNKFRYIVPAGHPLLHPGDSIWGISKTNMQRIALGKVSELRKTGVGTIARGERKILGEIYEITLSQGIRVPETVTFFENASYNPEVIIRNNTFGRANRARGILLTSPCKTIVEENVFKSSGTAILIEGDTDFWLESGGINGLVIKNNIFDKCHSSPWGSAVIAFSPSHKPDKSDSGMYHKNVYIINNRFIMDSAELLFLRSVENLIFENNRIEGNTPVIIKESYKGENIWTLTENKRD